MAYKWFAKTPIKGHAAAQCRLGYYYMNSQYVQKNTKKALKCLTKVSKQNYVDDGSTPMIFIAGKNKERNV